MPGRRRNREAWSELLAEFAASQQTVETFCAEQGMSPGYFLKKRAQLKREKRTPFVRAKVAVSADLLTVQIQDVQIRCTSNLSPVWLAELAAALRR
jgi:hypothetical protein